MTPWCVHLGNQIDLIRSEGARILSIGGENPDRTVPQYPEWTLRDLLGHTGAILGRTAMVCRDGLMERPSAPRPDDGVDPIDFYESQLEAVVEVLSSTDLDRRVWGFGKEPTVASWVTRMLVEVGVHRFDAERSVGTPAPLHPDVARAGLDEFEEMWLLRLEGVSPLRLTATDLDATWEFGSEPTRREVEGTGSDLYLRLMSRPSPVVLPGDWVAAVDALAPPRR